MAKTSSSWTDTQNLLELEQLYEIVLRPEDTQLVGSSAELLSLSII